MGEQTGLLNSNVNDLYGYMTLVADLVETNLKTITNRIVYFKCCHTLLVITPSTRIEKVNEYANKFT